jgi:hypothetical protein
MIKPGAVKKVIVYLFTAFRYIFEFGVPGFGTVKIGG